MQAVPPSGSQVQVTGEHKVNIPHAEEGIGSSDPLENERGAWLVILGTWLVQFCTYGYVAAYGVYQDFYAREFLNNQSPSTISWIGSFQLFLQYALGAVVGRIFDMGYFHHLIVAGTVLQTTAVFMLSLTRPHHYPEVFLAQAVGMGLGQAMLFLPSISIIAHHFKCHRALATGVAVSGASAGGIIWPILLNQTIQKLDFHNAVRITAAIIGGLLFVANFLYSIGCSRPKNDQPRCSEKPDFAAIFTDWAYLVSIASAFCINLGLFFPFFYLQSYALSQGIQLSLAFYLLPLLNVGSIFGRLLPNFLADKFGVYNMLLLTLYISSALVFAILGIKSLAGLTIFSLLYGFWSGSYVSLIPSLLVQLSPTPGERGIRMGIAFSIVGISLLIGTPIEGRLLRVQETGYDWSGPIIFCGVMSLCGAVGMTVSRYLYTRSRQIPAHQNRV